MKNNFLRVLVTGGSGFLGTYAVAALAQAGHAVTIFDRSPPTEDLMTVHAQRPDALKVGSIEDRDRLVEVCQNGRFDAVVHLVAQVGVEPSLEDPLGFYQTNVIGTATVCEAARLAGVRRLVLISSSSVYHDGGGPALVETDSVFSISRANPLAHYGTSKLAAEAVGMAFAEFHALDFIALRVSAIYGFGMKTPIHVKPLVEGAVLGHRVRIPSGGGMKRDYIHVRDVARAIVQAVQAPPMQLGLDRVFNISSATLCSSSDLASIVRREVGACDVEISPSMTPSEEENVKTRRPLQNLSAAQALGWTPTFSLDSGIKEYAEAFRSYMGN